MSDSRAEEARRIIQRVLDDLAEIEALHSDGADEDRVEDRLRRWRARATSQVAQYLPPDELEVWQTRAKRAAAVPFWSYGGDALSEEMRAHRAFLTGALDDLQHPESSLVGRETVDEIDRLRGNIDRVKNLMIAVATGGPRINDVDADYKRLLAEVADSLAELGLNDPNPFPSLWDWYGKWSSEIAGYQPRREFVAALYEPTLRLLRQRPTGAAVEALTTGWEEVDRRLRNLRADLDRASQPEHYQQLAYGCRELYVALAEAVHDPARHPPSDPAQTVKSSNDANGRLADYFAAELGDESSALKDYAKAVIKFANAAGHNRELSFRAAAASFQAAVCLVNLVALISGRQTKSG